MIRIDKKPKVRLPKTVYKYRDWSNPLHRKILKNEELFFASAKGFNDPFDVNIPLRFDMLTKGEMEEYIEEQSNIFKKDSDIQKDEDERRKIFKKKFIDNEAYKRNEFISAIGDHWYKELYESFGLLSLSTKKDNILMWSHYSKGHEGFCVGFNFKKLVTSLQKKMKTPVLTAIVNYSHKYPLLKPRPGLLNLENVFDSLMRKSNLWKYENEYRLVVLEKTNLKARVDKEVFNEIILGYKMAKENKEKIIEIVKRKFPMIQIYQARKSLNEFKLTFEEIE